MIAAIIPARGGSKEIPRKNIKDFCGKPLIFWTIEAALGANYVDKVYVSTDSSEIAEVAKSCKAEVIIRPAELSTDTSSSESALLHAMQSINRQEINLELIVFLQATSPVRESKDIDEAIETLKKARSDSLFSSTIAEDFCIWRKSGGVMESVTYDYLNRGRRQDRESLLLENGSIYVLKPEILEKFNNRLGGKIENYNMPFWKSFEIDSLSDFHLCELLMQNILRGDNNNERQNGLL